MAWHGPTWLKLQGSFLVVIVTAILWYLPLIAYLMVVSVWSRRNAFLWAVLPPVAILAIENMILGSNHFGEFLGHRLLVCSSCWKARSGRPRQRHADGARSARSSFRGPHGHETWLGVLVAGDDLAPSASAASATTAPDPPMRAARGLHSRPPSASNFAQQDGNNLDVELAGTWRGTDLPAIDAEIAAVSPAGFRRLRITFPSAGARPGGAWTLRHWMKAPKNPVSAWSSRVPFPGSWSSSNLR
jgi:hypothetical protein